MANAKSFVQQLNGFVGGLITEATELSFPPNASSDELNCILYPKGLRGRRFGVDFQEDYVLSSFSATDAELQTAAFNTFSWKGINEIGSLNFLVLQLGKILYFYDFRVVPLSNGAKSFTVNLDSYLAPAATTASETIASFACGRGDLYVVSDKITPIKITYDKGTDTLTVTEINIRIRDFAGVDDGTVVDVQKTTLAAAHHYNLLNQGWFKTTSGYDPLAAWHSLFNKYPSNNLQWSLLRNATTDRLGSTSDDKAIVGNSEAPKGHFIIDPFLIDRSSVSRIVGLPVIATDARPVAVGFYAGRVVYVLGSSVYISQVLNQSRDNAGKCYQDGDPTSEIFSDLVATDGLVINVPNANDFKGVAEVGKSLLLFASNGVWSITGADGGFKATDFTVAKVTSSGVISNRSVVDIEGVPVWASDTGIYTVTLDASTGEPTAVSLTETTIKSFYNAIPAASLVNMQGAFDKATGRIVWMYKGEGVDPGASPYYYNRALLFDVNLKAFYPWQIEDIAFESPYITGIAITPSLNLEDVENAVTLTDGTVVIVTAGDTVVVGVAEKTPQASFFQYITIVPNTTTTANNITFSEFSNDSFTDWEKYGIIVASDVGGTAFESFLECGWDLQKDAIRFKQVPYITVHCKRTEVGVSGVDTTPVYSNPSGLYLRAKWDWSNGSQSGKWGAKQKAYRLKSIYLPAVDDSAWDNGMGLTSTKLRIRGDGRALQLRFESETGKDFNLVGWGTVFTGTTDS